LGPFLLKKKKPNGSKLPNWANALDSAQTIRWLMSTSKPNGRIQCNVLSMVVLGLMVVLKESFKKRTQQSTQRREEEKREEILLCHVNQWDSV